MTDAWSSLLQAILWVSVTLYFVFKFRKTLSILPEIIKKRLEKDAPFTIGPVSIGTPPEAIKRGEKGGVTSEGAGGVSTPEELESLLINRNYPDIFTDEFFLVHSWEALQPSSPGVEWEYRVRLWLEGSTNQSLDFIKKVTYRLPQGFPKQVIATEARDRNFELWLNVSSELNIIAHVEKEDNSVVWLNRHLTLPGRPYRPAPLPLLSRGVDFEIYMDVLDTVDSKPIVVSDDAEWTIRLKWEIPALEVNLTGYWQIQLFFEELIGNTDKVLNDIAILKPTLEAQTYRKDIRIDAGFLPIGLFKMAVVATIRTENNKPVPVGGLGDGELIYIQKKSPFDLKHPFEIPVRAKFLGKDREEIKIIAVEEPLIIHVEWNTQKQKERIFGYWEIEVFLEPIGLGETVKLPDNPFVVNMKLDPSIYEEEIHLEPKSVKPGHYNVVIIVKNVGEGGIPTNLIGVFLGRMVQFFSLSTNNP